jgi:hypothetical protein
MYPIEYFTEHVELHITLIKTQQALQAIRSQTTTTKNTLIRAEQVQITSLFAFNSEHRHSLSPRNMLPDVAETKQPSRPNNDYVCVYISKWFVNDSLLCIALHFPTQTRMHQGQLQSVCTSASSNARLAHSLFASA